MSKLQRKELFIKMTTFLYYQAEILYSEQAERLEKEYPKLGKNRMKNLRASKTKVYPKVYEIEAVRTVFQRELARFKSDIGELSETEKRLKKMEEEITQIKEYLETREEILAEIARISKEYKNRSK